MSGVLCRAAWVGVLESALSSTGPLKAGVPLTPWDPEALRRLREFEATYGPDDLFRLSTSIPPRRDRLQAGSMRLPLTDFEPAGLDLN